MFTGLIKKIGVVQEINSHHGDIQAVLSTDKKFVSFLSEGESLSINGVCLTVYNIKNSSFCVDISNETLDVTNLTQLCSGYEVNIETSLTLNDKLGGHLVSGHVDCIAQIIDIKADSRSYKVGVKLENDYYSKYIVKKGSICIDGVSLTVNSEDKDCFYVNIIPHTWNNTIIKNYKIGTVVNIEIDKIALYIEKLITDNK